MDEEKQRERYRERPNGMPMAEWYRRLYILGYGVSEIARLTGKGYQPVWNTIKGPGTEPGLERSRKALEEERTGGNAAGFAAAAEPPGDGARMASDASCHAVLTAILDEVRVIRQRLEAGT